MNYDNNPNQTKLHDKESQSKTVSKITLLCIYATLWNLLYDYRLYQPKANPAIFQRGNSAVGRTLFSDRISLNFSRCFFSWSHISWRKTKMCSFQNVCSYNHEHTHFPIVQSQYRNTTRYSFSMFELNWSPIRIILDKKSHKARFLSENTRTFQTLHPMATLNSTSSVRSFISVQEGVNQKLRVTFIFLINSNFLLEETNPFRFLQ